MSEEQLKAFLEKVKADTSLKEKLKAAKSPEDVVGIAKEHGHEFTADKISQLSEEELEGVAGGMQAGSCNWICFVNGVYINDGRMANKAI
ncbi:conserved hypothetical protein [Prochlorococcus marinus str. MIT 9313]|uniref:Nif11 domain-containing protein n=1 Tax=Prochlorococcus marinus (strain MIT 9313) TaxID=74547 RepID=Q7V439_PROMM|nr:Nif11-like leader peptide family natural product precursor [Prochlorococcus marinus]CAE22305.1 conserved hypothetical protein [Prochlorococcus marinus str. MIT 9313]